MLILVADAFHPSLREQLQEFGTLSGSLEDLSEAEVLLVRSKTKCTARVMASAPKLKLIVRGGVGLDNIDRETAEARGIAVRNTPRASSVAVAEMAMALLLAVTSRLVEGHMGMARDQWLKKQLPRTELCGKTLGIVGLGNIGREVASRARAFGMRIIAYDKFVASADEVELMDDLASLLAAADFVSLHTPLTDETRGMIDAAAIELMKPEAMLVNTGRSGCVDLDALAAALESGRIRAYATDVWPSDPPPDDCPILGLPNVIMSPHLGASSQENLLRIGEEIVDILKQYTRGVRA